MEPEQSQHVTIEQAMQELGLTSDRAVRELVSLGRLESVEPQGVNFKRNEARKFITRASLEQWKLKRAQGPQPRAAATGSAVARTTEFALDHKASEPIRIQIMSDFDSAMVTKHLSELPANIAAQMRFAKNIDHHWMRPDECAAMLGMPTAALIHKAIRAKQLRGEHMRGKLYVRVGDVKKAMTNAMRTMRSEAPKAD